MNTFDTIILIPVIIGFIFGLSKGFIREILSLAVIFIGIYGSKLLSPVANSIMTGVFSVPETVAKPISFVIMFLIIAFSLMILAKSLDKLIDSVSLGGLNKLFGGLFGGLKYALLISLLLNVFDTFNSHVQILNNETKTGSLLYQPALKLAPKLWDEVKTRKNEPNKNENN